MGTVACVKAATVPAKFIEPVATRLSPASLNDIKTSNVLAPVRLVLYQKLSDVYAWVTAKPLPAASVDSRVGASTPLDVLTTSPFAAYVPLCPGVTCVIGMYGEKLLVVQLSGLPDV